MLRKEFVKKLWNLLNRSEVFRRPTVLRRGFVRGGDAEQQRFTEGPGDEIHADRQLRRYWPDELCLAVAGAFAIPDVRRKPSRYVDRRESLLPEHEPADRVAAVAVRLARRQQLSRWHRGHRRHERVELLLRHAVHQERLQRE